MSFQRCWCEDQNLKILHIKILPCTHYGPCGSVGYLGAFLAPVIRAFPSLLPDTSVLTTELGHRTLGRPYRIYITRELSVTVHEFGPVVAESKCISIREAFNDFQHRLAGYDEVHEHFKWFRAIQEHTLGTFKWNPFMSVSISPHSIWRISPFIFRGGAFYSFSNP